MAPSESFQDMHYAEFAEDEVSIIALLPKKSQYVILYDSVEEKLTFDNRVPLSWPQSKSTIRTNGK